MLNTLYVPFTRIRNNKHHSKSINYRYAKRHVSNTNAVDQLTGPTGLAYRWMRRLTTPDWRVWMNENHQSDAIIYSKRKPVMENGDTKNELPKFD